MKIPFLNIKPLLSILLITGGMVLITSLALIGHSYAKQAVYVKAQNMVDRMLKDEMTARGESVFERERHTITSIVRSYTPVQYPFDVEIITEDGPRSYTVDSIADKENIAKSIEMRMMQSISMAEDPFQVDSFQMVCEDLLAANFIHADLGFKLYHDGNVEAMGGNISHVSPFHVYIIGFGSEYRLETFIQMPFFFHDGVIFTAIILTLTYAFITVRAWHWYKEKKKVIPLSIETGKGTYLLNGHWLYASEEQCIYSLSKRGLFKELEKTLLKNLPNREAQIFDELLQAPNHSIDEDELYNKVWGTSPSMTKDNNLRSQVSRLKSKIKEVGLTITHDKKKYILQSLNLETDKDTRKNMAKNDDDEKADSGPDKNDGRNKPHP